MSTENNSLETQLAALKKATAVLAHFSKFEQAVPGSAAKIKQAVQEINQILNNLKSSGAEAQLLEIGNYTIVDQPKDLRDIQVQNYCLKYLNALEKKQNE